MKKTLTAILALALAQSALPRDIVATNSVDTVFTWHVNDLPGGGVEITGIDPKPVLEFEVPAAFSTENQTFPVKRIGNGAFANSIGMTSVTLPSTLERIGDSAFANCTSLADVSIPYGVREIGKRPFVNTIITGLALPDSIIKIDGNIAAGALFDLGNALANSSHFLVTGDGAVYNRDQTKLYSCPTRTEGTLNLPESLTEIGADAFFGCFRLTYLNIPANVSIIGEAAFNVSGIWPGLDAPESTAKLQSIYFEGSAPSAAEDIFSGAPETLVNYAFSDDPDWTDPWKGRPMTVIPDDAKPPILSGKDEFGIIWYFRIRKGFVEICNEDANGNPIAAISPKSTSGQTYEDKEAGLKQTALRIPKSINGFAVTKIGDSAFAGCEGLTSIGIPGSVTEIGDQAFRGCKALKSVDVWDNVPWETTQGHINLPYGINKIGYHAFEGVQLQALSLPDTVTELCGNPAAGCANLATIEVSSANPKFTVVDGVLYDRRKTTLLAVPACLDISTTTLPASVSAIGDEAFCGCQYLDTIVLPPNLATIGSNAFANCVALAKVTFEGPVPEAPDGIFEGSELVTVYGREENGWSGDEWKGRPLTVISASEEPADTTLMQTINGITWRFRVVDGVAEIWNEGNAAVECDSPVMSVTLPATLGGYVVKGIGDGALANLRGITSVSVPSTYEWIGDSAFSNCTSLAAVTIPEGVREIGHWPFFGTALTALAIPDSVSAIDGNPVAGAALMKEIKVSDSQPYFTTDDGLLYDKDQTALLACPATKKTVALPDTLETIADDAFYGCNLLTDGTDAIDDIMWSYRIMDGYAVVTEVYGGTNTVTVPATLGGKPVTQIIPEAFNDCRGITKFAVEAGNTAFVAKNGALYSADGKTLIRVPDTYQLEATVKTQTQRLALTVTIVPAVNPDGTDGTTYTTNSVVKKSTKSSRTLPSTVPVSTLLKDVTAIADRAFTGCGIIEGIDTTVTTNGAGVSTTGFIGDKVYVKTTYDITSTTSAYEEIVCVPENIACGDKAFDGSGVTEVRRTPVASIRLTAVTAVNGRTVAVKGGSDIRSTVGIPFSISLENMLPDGSSSASISAKGLPAGLKLVKHKDGNGKISYTIEGTPTKQVDGKTITLTAKKGNVLAGTLTFSLSLNPLPPGALGGFSGFITRPTNGDAFEDIGTFTLTTTEAGKITAKVITANGTTSFTSSHWDSISDSGLCSAHMTTSKGAILDITVNTKAPWDAMQVSGTFSSGPISGNVTAQKNLFSNTWAFTCIGNDTDGWILHTAKDAKSTNLKVTLKANGTTSISGKLGSRNISASGTANTSVLRDGILAADFVTFLKRGKTKQALSIRTDLRLDRQDPPDGVGRAEFTGAN